MTGGAPPRYNFFLNATHSEPSDVQGPLSEFPEKYEKKQEIEEREREREREKKEELPMTNLALREAAAVQGETLAAIERVERAMNAAEDYGEASLQQLREDGTIIEIIDNALTKNEPILQRARRDVFWLKVQLQKDKLFICLFIVAATLSVAAIIVAVVYRRQRQ